MALRAEARKPLYAVVGAGDLAVENLKELPGDLLAQATKTSALVGELPAKMKDLRGEVETRATKLTGIAFQTYGGLVERGQKLLRRGETAPVQAPAPKATAKKATKNA